MRKKLAQNELKTRYMWVKEIERGRWWAAARETSHTRRSTQKQTFPTTNHFHLICLDFCFFAEHLQPKSYTRVVSRLRGRRCVGVGRWWMKAKVRVCACLRMGVWRGRLSGGIHTGAFVTSRDVIRWITHITQVKHTQKSRVKNDGCSAEPTSFNSQCVY